MLEELTLKNFKLFDEHGVTIRPGLVTVFIGPNGTGKSTVLQALVSLKKSKNSNTLLTDGPPYNLGPLTGLVHGQDLTREISIDVTFQWHDPQLLGASPRETRYRYESSFDPWSLKRHNIAIERGKSQYLRVAWSRDPSDTSYLGEVEPRFLEFLGHQFEVRADYSVGHPFELTDVASAPAPGFAAGAESYVARVAQNAVINFLDTIYVVPAVRGFSRFAVPLSDTVENDLAAKGPAEQEEQLASALVYGPQVMEWVSKRLFKVTERYVWVQLIPSKQVAVYTFDRPQAPYSVSIVNEGQGTNALLLPLTQLSLAPLGSVVCIEEPEIHLHPGAQAALCQVFVEAAIEQRKQVVLATHSEHILMGLVTAVAEGKLKPEELAVYYFSREGDTARAERLEVTEQGQIKGGLKGFFEVEIEEMQRYMEALSQKNPS